MSILQPGKKVALCSDHAGYELKSIVEGYLTSQGIEYEDFGTFSAESCDYADYAHPCAKAVEEGRCYPAIGICGSGNGINMTLNKKVWKAAKKLGYARIFIDEDGGGVTDDHLFINRLARIKTIDIIASDPEGGFTPTWHTLTDNMEHIDKNTLKAVGQTVLEVIYNEK